MKVRLIMPWANWSKGHVFPEMPGGQARTLIARGIAEEVRDEPPPAPRGAYPDRRMVAESATPARPRRSRAGAPPP